MPRPISIIDLLSASLRLTSKDAVQLLPAGQFAARDGRPGPGKYWTLSDEAGTRLATEMTATAAQSRFVFDVDHQTLHASTNGQPAPAAGWATRFEWRPGQGLYAIGVQWTDRARAWIDADEYAYISPVIAWDESGQVTSVLMAAITNYPALLGMEPISAALTACLAALSSTDPKPAPKDAHAMDLLAQLIALLGLQTGTSAEAVVSAIKALKAKADGAAACAASPGVAQALGLTGVPDEATALAAIATLRGGDVEGHKLIATLQGQLVAITTQMNTEKVNTLVTQAITDRKLLPAQKDWATALGRKDLAELQGYLATAPALLPGAGGQSGGVDPAPGASGTAALSAVQADVLAAMGVSAEDYAKQYGPKKPTA